jgi:hypothetical protein
MYTREPNTWVAETDWEASTRSVRPLGGPLFLDDPQETRLKLAHKAETTTRIRLFNGKLLTT